MERRTATPEERAEAVALVREVGVNETARRTGWDRGAVSRWARAEGVDTSVTRRVKDRTPRREPVKVLPWTTGLISTEMLLARGADPAVVAKRDAQN